MDTDVRKRLHWLELFNDLKNYTQVCLRCGISRPTLRKWVDRFRKLGIDGLVSESKRPKPSPAIRISEQERTWIIALRARGLGSRRIQNELKRSYDFDTSRPTIEKVLRTLDPRPRPPRLRVKGRKRYAKEISGERVQMDTCKIAPGVYQYTAVQADHEHRSALGDLLPADDCTRIRVLAVYSRRTAANSLRFLELAIEEFPFPIQRIQTDRGREFFATCFQGKLMEYGIKFRPVKPASPHLNGKVERSQRTDLEEFYPTLT